MAQKIATIEKIAKLEKHPNADSLSIATIQGWQVVVKTGEFKEGELCVYVEPDSLLEERPEYEFLRKNHFRIKPIKLRGIQSNGLCIPISSNPLLADKKEGEVVADIVGASHYEKPVPACLGGTALGFRPSFIPYTDEINGRSYSGVIEEAQGKEFYFSCKYDGSSGSFYFNNGKFGVCSRSLELKEDENNTFWKIARKYQLQNKLNLSNDNLCIQSECVGPGIQGNPLGLKEMEMRVFNIWDINQRAYLGLDSLKYYCNLWELPMVDIIWEGKFNFELSELINMANSLKYPNGAIAEGLICRPTIETWSQVLQGRLSFKIINENYKD